MTWIKICGVTRDADVDLMAELGVDAIGINLAPGSKRRVDVARGRELAHAARRAGLSSVAVVADLPASELGRVLEDVGVDRVQLHGHEPPEIAGNTPRAYQALRIADAHDVERAEHWPGEPLLLDAAHGNELGGTGRTFDWRLVVGLASRRRVVLAGGLDASNVAAALALVAPWGVDTASGSELPGAPGVKDRARCAAFVAAVRSVHGT